MPNDDWINNLFDSINNKDTEGFCKFLTADGEFRYGSQPAVKGTAAVNEYVEGFFSMIKSLTHDITFTRSLDDGATMLVGGDVIYTCFDDTVVSIPFLNKLEMEGDLISKYHVYADPAPLMEAVAAAQS